MVFTTLQIVQLGLLAAALLLLGLGSIHQMNYFKGTPRIETAAQLEDFKKFARTQMYVSVVFLALAVPAIALIFIDSEPKPTLAKRVVLWAPFGFMGLFSLATKSREKRIQDPARCAEELRPEFERVCTSWNKRMLPDF